MEVSVDRAVLYPSAKPSDIEVVKAALCYIGKVLAILLPSTMDCYEILSEKVIRAFLFAQIQLPHLCCNLDSTAIMNIESHAVNGNNVHYIDEESTQEDSEEHEEESARFEELLSDLLVRWRNDAGTMPLGEWVDIVLHPVTQAYLLTTDPRTTDYVKSVEALGVNVTTYTTTNPSKK
ncbi:hypothetical protein HII31_03995 [Pseudocercospora fuligena]|uniref:Uncharacterized protein n=1 Tax=Pseudocercospora fuligena TaxID=685502 RepID=A0A8H6RP57_9PEZI|nr:hypothetical protein HII31_03995 [Pseudocercospora fuligena]